MRMIPTAELPLLVSAFETHARRNRDRCLEPGLPDSVRDWSTAEAARYQAEADRIRVYHERRLAHDARSALG